MSGRWVVWIVLVRDLQWLNGWIGWCYSQDLYTKQQCSTQRTAPHQGSSCNISLRWNFLWDFLKTQIYIWSNTISTKIKYPKVASSQSHFLDIVWMITGVSMTGWLSGLPAPVHVTFPLPGGSSHFNLTLNWLFIRPVQVSKSLGITFQLETFKRSILKFMDHCVLDSKIWRGNKNLC